MPKAPSDTWQTVTSPQTPLQRGAFLNLCTHWLVRTPQMQSSDPLDTRTTWTPAESRDGPNPPSTFAPTFPPATTDSVTFDPLAIPLSMTRSELRIRSPATPGLADGVMARVCGFCGSGDDPRPVVANPYAQRYLVLVCAGCEGTRRSS